MGGMPIEEAVRLAIEAAAAEGDDELSEAWGEALIEAEVWFDVAAARRMAMGEVFGLGFERKDTAGKSGEAELVLGSASTEETEPEEATNEPETNSESEAPPDDVVSSPANEDVETGDGRAERGEGAALALQSGVNQVRVEISKT
jgi:hypothetical protein